MVIFDQLITECDTVTVGGVYGFSIHCVQLVLKPTGDVTAHKRLISGINHGLGRLRQKREGVGYL